jgi:hypothetical protein
MKVFYGKQQHGGSSKKKHQGANEVNKKINGGQLCYQFKS